MNRKRKNKREALQEQEAVERRAKRPTLRGKLHEARVEESTRKDYMRVRRFYSEWLLEHGHHPKTLEETDELAAEYAEHVYTSGQPGYRVKKLVAALELEDPLTTDKWVRLGAAAAGFRKLEESTPWPPLPAELTFAAAVILYSWGKKQSAIALLLSFHCYLRISEAVGLTKALVCLPGDATLGGSVRPSITVLKAKTGKLQSVLLENDLIIELLHRQRGSAVGSLVFGDLTAEQLREDLKLALQRLEVPQAKEERYVFHSLRHGGAAHDYHSGALSFEEVRNRGRWKSEDCCRLYVQRAKLWLVIGGLPEKCSKAVRDLVTGHHGKRFELPGSDARFARL